MSIYKILGHFDNVKECPCNAQGERQWSARCPAHSDRVNSLHIALSRNGKILLDCKAGCDNEDILRKVGLGMKDLFPEESGVQKPAAGRPVEVDIYPYQDIQNGIPLRKHRMQNPDGSKFFWWDHLEDGRWQKGLNGLVPHLYGLESVKEDRDVVVVVEGEKDVKTVRSFDSPCVTTPDGGGRKKRWQEVYDEAFLGKRVYIFPDNDGPGLDYARFVYDHVQDIAAKAFILNPKAAWPEMPEKDDISDMVDALGKEEALYRFSKLCDDADNGVSGATLPPFPEAEKPFPSLPQSSDADAADWTLQLECYDKPPRNPKPTICNRMVVDHLFPNESEQTKQKMSREIGQILSRSPLLIKTDERRYLPAPYGRQRGWLVADPITLERCA